MMNEQLLVDGYLHFNAMYFFFSQARFGHIWYLVALGLYAAVFLLFAVVIKKWKFPVNTVAIPILLGLIFLQDLRGPYYDLFHNAFTEALNSNVHQAVKRFILRGLPSFLTGTLIYYNRDCIFRITKNRTGKVLVVSLLLYIGEAVITVRSGLAMNAMAASIPWLAAPALFLFALQNPNILSTDPRHGRYCRKMSAFLYYFHPYWIYWFPRNAAPLVGSCTAADQFVICFALTFIIGNVLCAINNKYTNLLFS